MCTYIVSVYVDFIGICMYKNLIGISFLCNACLINNTFNQAILQKFRILYWFPYKTCTYFTTFCETGNLLVGTLSLYMMLHLNKTCTIVRNNSILNSQFIAPIFFRRIPTLLKLYPHSRSPRLRG